MVVVVVCCGAARFVLKLVGWLSSKGWAFQIFSKSLRLQKPNPLTFLNEGQTESVPLGVGLETPRMASLEA